MDYLDAQLVREMIERERTGVLRDPLRLLSRELAIRQRLLRDVEQSLLGEVADQTGIGAVLEDGRGALTRPCADLPAQVHVPPVERPLDGMMILGCVWIQSSTEVLM